MLSIVGVLVLTIVPTCYSFSIGEGLTECENAPFETEEDFDFVNELNWFEIFLGGAIIFFTFLCFAPQVYKILRRRDGTGLSPSFLLILSFNQVFAVINATIMNSPTIHSCFVIGFGKCIPPLLSYFQIAELMVMCYPIFVLFLFFYKDKTEKNFKRSLIYFISACIFLVFSISLIAFCVFYFGECSLITYYVGFTFGIGSTVTTVIEYLPQIWRTWRTKECGSMSFTTNWITTMGTAIITGYMIFSTTQHFTTLASYITSLIQHVVLCALQIKYDIIDKFTWKRFKNLCKLKLNVVRGWFNYEPLPTDPLEDTGNELELQLNTTNDATPQAIDLSADKTDDASPYPIDDLDSNIILGDEDIAL
ncbi:PQ loop repeat protein [Entamoeba marina]